MNEWQKFCEISPVYLWWSLRGKRLEEEMCFKSGVKKRRSDWWWQRWRWRCGSDLCRVVRRWKTRKWMRLTERVREFIPKVGCCMLKRTVCNFEWWGSRWSGYGANRRGSSTTEDLAPFLFIVAKLKLIYLCYRLHVQVGNAYCQKPTVLRPKSMFTPQQYSATWTCSGHCLPLLSNEFLRSTSNSCLFAILSSDSFLPIKTSSLTWSMQHYKLPNFTRWGMTMGPLVWLMNKYAKFIEMQQKCLVDYADVSNNNILNEWLGLWLKCPPFALAQERRRARHCMTAVSITRLITSS